MKKGRAVARSERDTYDRLTTMMMDRTIFGFRVPSRDHWQLFETEDEYKASLGQKDTDRVYLTQKQVREKYGFDKKEQDAAEPSEEAVS